jgi:Dyp-type peroxidase family
MSDSELAYTKGDIEVAINLTKPLAWKRASSEEQKMLQCLQGNILKGHGRTETVNIFFKMDAAKALEMKRVLRELANYHITSADRQLRETEIFHENGTPGLTFVAVFLSATGYAALGAAAQAPVGEPQFFKKGMRDGASVSAVNDNLSDWDSHFNQQIDGMVLVGDNDSRLVQFKRDEVASLLKEGGATIVHEQIGSVVKNHVNDGIEHFGYVDGRSQPLLLEEDIEREATTAGTVRWDPEFSLGAALVKDPSVTDTVSFGSYFIFRKLEQNVQGFKRQEQVLATNLGFAGSEKRELAGALVVGRFEDGTPVTLSNEAKGANPPNDFNYENDAAASRCPFHAHIRKVNPRHALASERAHIMPRRGIPFTDVPRKVHPSDLPGSEDLADFDANVKPDLPTGGVGLLFMAYNASLTNQFVFTQQTWANNKDFPSAGVGADPVIGQGPGTSVLQTWPVKWDDPTGGTHTLNFSNFVKMRGGEYFFAPSLTFFKNL